MWGHSIEVWGLKAHPGPGKHHLMDCSLGLTNEKKANAMWPITPCSHYHAFSIEIDYIHSNHKPEYILLLKKEFYFMHMSVLAACMYVYHVHAWCPPSPEEGVRCPGTGVTDSYKPSCFLGIKSGSSWRAASALEHWAIPLAPNPSSRPLVNKKSNS